MKRIMKTLLITLSLLVLSFGSFADQRLADKYGRTIGTIRVHPDGREVIQDPYGRTVGSYSPKAGSNGQTYDNYGRMIGTGNQLLLTLPPSDRK